METSMRDVLKRKIRWLFAMGLGAWLMMPLGLAILHGDPQPHGNTPPLLIIVGTVVFGAAMLLIQRVKCPKCSTPLGQIASAIAFRWHRRINYCPYCGVSLDEPVPHRSIS
jgi:hypothetical protein